LTPGPVQPGGSSFLRLPWGLHYRPERRATLAQLLPRRPRKSKSVIVHFPSALAAGQRVPSRRDIAEKHPGLAVLRRPPVPLRPPPAPPARAARGPAPPQPPRPPPAATQGPRRKPLRPPGRRPRHTPSSR